MTCTHKKYSGLTRPRWACPECWTKYARLHPMSTAGTVVYAAEQQGATLRSRQICALLLVLPDKTETT